MQQSVADLDKLIKAQAIFERFRTNMEDDRDQAGAIQAFKVCYELALRVMKNALVVQGVQAASPKEIFRKSVLAKIIDDSDIWFNFQEQRNLTVHTYEQENFAIIVECFDLFSSELTKMIQVVSLIIPKD